MLQDAVAVGEIGVADDRFQIPRLQAVRKDPAVDGTRQRLFREIGSAQLPDVIVETDARTGFSATLLGRPARGPGELEALYAGLLALRTRRRHPTWPGRLTASTTTASSSPCAASRKAAGCAACDQVTADMLDQPVAGLWGSGVTASADMMSLDVPRHQHQHEARGPERPEDPARTNRSCWSEASDR